MKHALLFCALLIGLTGCIPIPHTTERLHAMQGHIVDSVTHAPIPDAAVVIEDHPGTRTKTDEAGAFCFRTRRNYHLGFVSGICGPISWPQGTSWSEYLNISHPDYEAREVDAGELTIPLEENKKPQKLHDIELTRKMQ